MFRLPKFAAPLAGIALAAATLTVSTPREAHAVAAALVQLTNTIANPGVTQDVSKQAGQMVALSCLAASVQFTLAACFPNPGNSEQYTTPANQSLVITSVDIFTVTSGTYDFQIAAVPQGGPLSSVSFFGAWAGSSVNSTQHLTYPQGLVIPPHSLVEIINAGTGGSPQVNLYGYLTYQ
jgi:hypothetical protein